MNLSMMNIARDAIILNSDTVLTKLTQTKALLDYEIKYEDKHLMPFVLEEICLILRYLPSKDALALHTQILESLAVKPNDEIIRVLNPIIKGYDKFDVTTDSPTLEETGFLAGGVTAVLKAIGKVLVNKWTGNALTKLSLVKSHPLDKLLIRQQTTGSVTSRLSKWIDDLSLYADSQVGFVGMVSVIPVAGYYITITGWNYAITLCKFASIMLARIMLIISKKIT